MGDVAHVEIRPDEVLLNSDPATRAKLEAVADPMARFKQAATVAAEGYTNSKGMDSIRHQRRMAFGVLHIKYNVSKAEIMRLVKTTNRHILNDALDKVNDIDLPGARWVQADDGWVVEFEEMSEEDAAEERALYETVAKLTHAELGRRDKAARTAREMMRVLMHEFETGVHGYIIIPARLAEMSGLSDARITQIRTGTTNPPKAQKKRRPRGHAKKRTTAVS